MRVIRVLALLAMAAITTTANAQPPGRGPGYGRGGMGRGRDASMAADQSIFHDLLGSHDKIERTVTEIPDGVQTRTTSQEPELAEKIREHVAAMAERVKQGRPVRRWDPLFAELFAHGDRIEIAVKEVPGGVEVTETSEDPRVVKLIQAHARVVSGFVAKGFEEARQAHELPSDRSEKSKSVDAATAARVVETSAVFDQLYIPALALTNQGKAQAAERAIQRLNDRLPRLVSSLEAVGAGERGLLKGVAERVQAAQRLTASGELQEAHETLEPIRDQLAERRRELGVSYPLDVLSDYHAVMESIAKPAMKAGADEVDQAFRRRTAALAAEAYRVWALAEQTDFALPKEPSGWPAPEATQANLSAVRASITTLNYALRGEDSEALLVAARALKPTFAKLYMSFGVFGEFGLSQ